MPQYINPNPYDLTLVGPNGEKIPIRRGRRVRLPEFFERYVKKGFLQKVDDAPAPTSKPKRQIRSAKSVKTKTDHVKAQKIEANRKRAIRNMRRRRRKPDHNDRSITAANYRKRPLGRPKYLGVTEDYKQIIKSNSYPISNGIGVGILSYNRFKSLKRLIDSIVKHTSLNRTTIFISDDGSKDQILVNYLKSLQGTNNFVVIRNEERLGIAGNTNRLLRCLERFPNKLILNDDVQVLHDGWEKFYFDAMKKTSFHHFCCRTAGVYGAKEGKRVEKDGVALTRVDDKPHGAVMAFDHKAFEKVGYFDEKFGMYGCEHVDWSDRVIASGLQDKGYYDAVGSSKFFLIHSDKSAVENRIIHLQKARAHLKKVAGRSGYIETTDKTKVPAISYVIPCRDVKRGGAILAVINNIKAQRYPAIEIIVSEQDWASRFKDLGPVRKILVKTPEGSHFNKSKAFNAGVDICSNEMIVLHDADTLVLANYTKSIAKHLKDYDSCFLGARVLYANRKTSQTIIETGTADTKVMCEKSVEYFEGGTIGVKRAAYWKVGGFNEEFWGYGCEDCDFYSRLSEGSNFNENRHVPLLHLWHSRTKGWEECHSANKRIEAKLKELDIKTRIGQQRARLKKTKYSRNL